MRFVLAIVAATAAAVSATPSQTTPTVVGRGGAVPAPATVARDNVAAKGGTAVIRGRVLAADTGAPLTRAEVTLTAPGLNPNALSVVATDEQGRYEFRNMPAGLHILRASKPGYVPLAYGQRRAVETARPLTVAAGQVFEGLDLALPRGGVIAARVVDELGEPMAGVNATVYRLGFSQGARTLVPVPSGVSGPLNSTYAREHRLFGLPPGDYYIGVAPQGGPGGIAADGGRTYVTTFYPGTVTEQDAQRVTVGLGQEVSIVIRMSPMKLTRITGTIRNSEGRPVARSSAYLEYRRPGGVTSSYPVGTRPDGTLVANNVPPGEYVLTVAPVTGGDTEEVARMPLTIGDREITGLSVVTGKGATIRGRFVFDTGTPPTDVRPGSLQALVLFPPPGGGVTAFGSRVFNPDWTFELRGILGTGGVIRAQTGSSRWFAKAIMVGGRDVIDTPLDFETGQDLSDVQIVLTQKRTEVTGGAMDEKGGRSIDYVAVLFPEDRAQWTGQSRMIASGQPDQMGRFRIEGLPPGRYLGAAVDYLEPGEERDPDRLKRLADSAVPVTLGEGEVKNINLRLAVY
jgi:hypothetical protein